MNAAAATAGCTDPSRGKIAVRRNETRSLFTSALPLSFFSSICSSFLSLSRLSLRLFRSSFPFPPSQRERLRDKFFWHNTIQARLPLHKTLLRRSTLLFLLCCSFCTQLFLFFFSMFHWDETSSNIPRSSFAKIFLYISSSFEYENSTKYFKLSRLGQVVNQLIRI